MPSRRVTRRVACDATVRGFLRSHSLDIPLTVALPRVRCLQCRGSPLVETVSHKEGSGMHLTGSALRKIIHVRGHKDPREEPACVRPPGVHALASSLLRIARWLIRIARWLFALMFCFFRPRRSDNRGPLSAEGLSPDTHRARFARTRYRTATHAAALGALAPRRWRTDLLQTGTSCSGGPRARTNLHGCRPSFRKHQLVFFFYDLTWQREKSTVFE